MKRVKPSAHGRRAEQCLRKAVASVVEENRKLGLPVAVMRDGKAVLIPVEEAMSLVREERTTYRTKRTRR
jgi:hypothetical protein